MSRRPSLSRLFADLNRSHFGGRLPHTAVRRVPGLDRLGTTRMQDGRLAILIKADHESAEHERQTLLHEMCHVATWGVEERMWP